MKSMITMEFARRDDCLDKMVPSDLRVLIGERDSALEQLKELEVVLQNVKSALLPNPEKGELEMAREMIENTTEKQPEDALTDQDRDEIENGQHPEPIEYEPPDDALAALNRIALIVYDEESPEPTFVGDMADEEFDIVRRRLTASAVPEEVRRLPQELRELAQNFLMVEQGDLAEQLSDMAADAEKALASPPAVSDDYKEKYHELLYAVAKKHPGESRHETALRYIKNAESGMYCLAETDIDKGERLMKLKELFESGNVCVMHPRAYRNFLLTEFSQEDEKMNLFANVVDSALFKTHGPAGVKYTFVTDDISNVDWDIDVGDHV